MQDLKIPRANNEWVWEPIPLLQLLPNVGLPEGQSVDSFQLTTGNYVLNLILRDNAELLMACEILHPDTKTSYVKDCDPTVTETVAIISARSKSSYCTVIATTLKNFHFLQDLSIACDVFYGLMLLWTKSKRSTPSVICDYLDGWNCDYQNLIKKEGNNDQELHHLIASHVSGVLFVIKQHKTSDFNL